MSTKTLSIRSMHMPEGISRTRAGRRHDTIAAIFHWPQTPGGRGWTNDQLYRFWVHDAPGGWGGTQYSVGVDAEIAEFMPPDRTAYQVGSSRDYETGVRKAPATRAYTPFARDKFGVEFCQHRAGHTPNFRCVGAEVSECRADGYMSPEVLESARSLFAWLCQVYSLDPMTDLLTHHQVVGWKDCPRWFVHHPAEFEAFRQGVADVMARHRFVADYR